MLCNVLWQGEPITVLVTGQGSDVEVTATPVVVSYWFGVTPGLFFIKEGQFGWWYSSNITDIINAWRVAQLLPKAKRLRQVYGYDQTLCTLVLQLRGDNYKKRLENLADDFGLSVHEMTALLEATKNTGPTDSELEDIFEKMQERLDDYGDILTSHLQSVEKAEAAGVVRFSARSLYLVEQARSRSRSKEEQMEADEQEIAQPVPIELSFAQVAVDLGIRNLMDTSDIDWGPTHIKLEVLDNFIKRHSIGREGYYQGLPLVVSEKDPDDPSAHYSHATIDGAITIFGSDFGKSGRPWMDIGDVRLVLHRVRYDRGGEFMLKFSERALPTTADEDDVRDAKELSLTAFRELLGQLLELGGPLPLGYTLEPVGATSLPKGIRRWLHRDN